MAHVAAGEHTVTSPATALSSTAVQGVVRTQIQAKRNIDGSPNNTQIVTITSRDLTAGVQVGPGEKVVELAEDPSNLKATGVVGEKVVWWSED